MAAAGRKITYTAAEVAELIHPLTQSVEALQKENAELKHKLEHMNEILANAQRARFGQSSEKRSYILSEDQMSLFNEAEICQDSKAEEPTEETLTVKAHARKKKRTIDELAKNLPVEEIVIGLPESSLTCDKCGGTFKLIGKKLVRRELIIIPQSEKILEYYSCTYACDKCEKDTGFAHIITTRTTPPLMKHSLASPSTVADVMTKKYVDGVPLARQEKIWARQGVELSRVTMANWVIRCAQSWLKPLYKHMNRQLLEQSVIHADETVVQVLKEDNKPVASESRMWLYASGEYSSQYIRIFEYQPDRSGKRPESFLKGFSGCLITDGYYADVKARKEYRQNEVLPLLEEYFAWLKSIHPEKGSKLEDAVRYSLNRKQQLMAFLDYGDVPISNNLAENAIRPFAVGRKNWLFCDSVKGAESSAIVYSLVETAKANGIEPYGYLLLVLSMLPYLGKSPTHEELEKLMP